MLQKLGFLPGFNKQVSELGAEGQWTGGDNVRFRYGTPEKLAGWDQLGADKLTGVGRALHHWDDNAGIKYAAIGTNRILYVYSGGIFYDIHPVRTTITGCDFSSTSSEKTVTITFPSPHGLIDNDIVLMDGVSGVTAVGSTYNDASFEDIKFMVTSAPTSTTIEVTMAATETGTPLSNSGSASGLCYYTVGPAQQLGGYGWGTGTYSGTSPGPATTTLATTLPDDATTSVVLTNSAAFPTSGEIRIGTEDISFAANNTSTNTLSGGARAVNGTTRAAHTAGVTITDISDYVGWGDPSSSDYTIDPGLWVLDNYGTKLIALIYNGACFEWDATGSTSTRATRIANTPTASRHVLVSTPDRHLVFIGTETTIGDTSSQDDMFIRWSNQEEITGTNSYTVTATNTAGTQRLAAGSVIMGAKRGRDAIYVWTDTSLFLMRFVGQPFTFSFEQAGTNCGLIGKNACVEVDGISYWMSENGFFMYDGQLKSMPCLVEDFVYDGLNSTPKDLINCGLNNLFGEIQWFYCSTGSDVVDRVVTYSYVESKMYKRPIWTTNSNSLFQRTTWVDSAVFDKPHATAYDATDDASFDVVGNTDGTAIYYEHETGTDQVDSGGVITPITSHVLSGDFDITQKRSAQGSVIGMPDLRGDGEYIMKIRRFIPDFITQTGNTQVSLLTKNFPNDSTTTTSFTITTASDKVDTRVRARSIALKIANTSSAEDWKLGTFRLDIQPDGRRG